MIQLELFQDVRPTWGAWLVSWLIWHANAGPPAEFRYRFYKLKDKLLDRFASREGTDWQHIKHHCWSCDGTGNWGYWRWDGGDACYRCNGTGVYREFFVELERYSLAGRMFHRPLDRAEELPDGASVNIEGVVRHSHCGSNSVEAFLWLALLFDRGMFWQAMRWPRINNVRRYSALRPKWFPLFRLWWLGRKVAWFWKKLGRPFRGRCENCGGVVWPWSSGCGTYCCRACEFCGHSVLKGRSNEG